MRIPDSARAVLESNALGHLVTINPDGSPQVSVIWVGPSYIAHITVEKIGGVGPWA